MLYPYGKQEGCLPWHEAVMPALNDLQITHRMSSSCQLMEFARTLFGVDCTCTWVKDICYHCVSGHFPVTASLSAPCTMVRNRVEYASYLHFYALLPSDLNCIPMNDVSKGARYFLKVEPFQTASSTHLSQSLPQNWGPRRADHLYSCQMLQQQ